MQIGVLTHREVEARIRGPVVEAMWREFGRQAVEKDKSLPVDFSETPIKRRCQK